MECHHPLFNMHKSFLYAFNIKDFIGTFKYFLGYENKLAMNIVHILKFDPTDYSKTSSRCKFPVIRYLSIEILSILINSITKWRVPVYRSSTLANNSCNSDSIINNEATYIQELAFLKHTSLKSYKSNYIDYFALISINTC